MKRNITLLYILIAMFGFTQAFANNGEIRGVWSFPAAFEPDEEVELFFDLGGTTFSDYSDLYLFSWSPREFYGWTDAKPAGTKLTLVEGSIYKLPKQKLTDLYGVAAGEFGLIIQGLIRNGEGTEQTSNFDEDNGNAFRLFDFSTMANRAAVVWPERFTANRPATIVMNRTQVCTPDGKQSLENQPNIKLHSGVNVWQKTIPWDQSPLMLATSNENVFKLDMTSLNTYYGLDAGTVVNEINFVFNNGAWDHEGKDPRANCGDFRLTPPTDASTELPFEVHPTQFTQKDIVVLTYNPSLDIEGTEFGQGVLANELKIYVRMLINDSSDSGFDTNDDMLMQNLGDGRYRFVFILDDLKERVSFSGGFPGVAEALGISFFNATGQRVHEETPLTIEVLEADN